MEVKGEQMRRDAKAQKKNDDIAAEGAKLDCAGAAEKAEGEKAGTAMDKK